MIDNSHHRDYRLQICFTSMQSIETIAEMVPAFEKELCFCSGENTVDAVPKLYKICRMPS